MVSALKTKYFYITRKIRTKKFVCPSDLFSSAIIEDASNEKAKSTFFFLIVFVFACAIEVYAYIG